MQEPTVNKGEDVEAFLVSAVPPIDPLNGECITESTTCALEANAVIAPVERRLSFIPLEIVVSH